MRTFHSAFAQIRNCDNFAPLTRVTLSNDVEAWAKAQVDAGHADSLDHAVAKAMEAKIAHDTGLDGELQKGLDGLDAGTCVDGIAYLEAMIDELDSEISREITRAA